MSIEFSPIQLPLNGGLIACELRAATADDVRQFETDWRPILQGRVAAGDPRWLPSVAGKLRRDAGFPWAQELASAGPADKRLVAAISCKATDRLEALMSLDGENPHWSRVHPTQRIVFVDYVAIAPWNQEELAVTREVKGLGRQLLSFAVEVARQLGYEGGFGLHSTPEAAATYEGGFKLWKGTMEAVPDDGTWLYFEGDGAWLERSRGGRGKP